MRAPTLPKLLIARTALALLLLITQQQAVLHWLGHAISATHAKYGGPLPSDHCDDCVSFSAFGSAAPSSYAPAGVPAPHEALAPYLPVWTAPTALRLAFRSRAPPILL